MPSGNIPNRRSIRLPEYDYRAPGAYFITICTFRGECIFGDIVDGRILLNEVGLVAEECWQSIPQHFPKVTLGEYVVMPNHFHAIVYLTSKETTATPAAIPVVTNVGAKQASPASPDSPDSPATSPITFQTKSHLPITGNHTGPDVVGCFAGFGKGPGEGICKGTGDAGDAFAGAGEAGETFASPLRSTNPMPLPTLGVPRGTGRGSLGAIVQNFKSVSTRKINAIRNSRGCPVWQRNYFEHIIRNGDNLTNIRCYITENPSKWELD